MPTPPSPTETPPPPRWRVTVQPHGLGAEEVATQGQVRIEVTCPGVRAVEVATVLAKVVGMLLDSSDAVLPTVDEVREAQQISRRVEPEIAKESGSSLAET